MNSKKVKSIHFTGIKGVGMTPLAIIAKEAGFKVTGSDIEEIFITDEPLRKSNINFTSFSTKNIQNQDLIITTGAHGGFDNQEVKEAKAKNIKILTQGEAVGEFMKGEIFEKELEGISVSGSHGKTTTTSMIAVILKACGYDPSYVIGTGEIPFLGLPGHYGKGKYFVAEADEYANEPIYDKSPKFLKQDPKILIITNIELDHPDLYPDLNSVTDAFISFSKKVEDNGLLIVNGDDPEVKRLISLFKGKIVTFGFSDTNDFTLKRVRVLGYKTFFWIEGHDADFGEFAINVPGAHNALNALASFIAANELGASIENVKKGLLEFKGSKRRFEFVGETEGNAKIFDDYAHHPTEIQKTIAAFRQVFPKEKLVCIFQPHTYSRTKKLFDQFLTSFSLCDEVIMAKIYPSLRETPDSSFSSADLVSGLNRFVKKAVYVPEIENVVEYVMQKKYERNTVIITMGAGDIYKVGIKLCK